MKAIILAAGIGKRLKPLTNRTPKCLLKIHKTTVLERQINVLHEFGISDITVVVGGEGSCWNQGSYSQIKEISHNLNIVVNNTNLTTDSTFSLHLALKDVKKGPILAIDGDVLFKQELIDVLLHSEFETALISRPAGKVSERGGRVVTDGDRVINIGKFVKAEEFPWNIHSGIVKIGNNIFDVLKKELIKKKHRKLNLVSPLRELCKKYKIYNITHHGWVNINSPELYHEAKRIFGGKRESKSF